MCEFSASSLRQVSEGEGNLQHFLNFALSTAENALEEVEIEFILFSTLIGKFVFAFLPLIKIAASSYALAASSAVSNVPNHTLLFLFIPPHKI
jgi:hypothetical protein